MDGKIYIGNLNKTSEENIYSIGLIHYAPFDVDFGLKKSKEELLKEGIFVDKIPNPTPKENESYEMLYNKLNNSVFYRYTIDENHLSLTDRVSSLEKENSELYYMLMMNGVI